MNDSPSSPDGQLLDAVRSGDAATVSSLLDAHPERLHLRTPPHEGTLLHLASTHGHLPVVDLLLRRGLDVNSRERGDNTYAMHWAAAAAHLAIVHRLAEAGGDVVGHGDDHELEVIGWATCWDGGDDAAHREVVDLLVERGARHHIFSAVALGLADEVRRIVADDPAALHRRMSRNEDHQLPLHFAVRRNRPEMVALLLELGADPLAVDGSGHTAAAYATGPHADRPVMERVRAMVMAELASAERGGRRPRPGPMDLVALLSLGDGESAACLLGNDHPASAPCAAGALHLMAKRNDPDGVRWLLARGADPDVRWSHWGADVTPLHLAAAHGHADVVRLLLQAGADPAIRDSMHGGDAIGWADHFGQPAIVRILEAHATP